MSENEPRVSGPDGGQASHHQLDLDIPSLQAALQSAPEERVDWHLGRGVLFRFGTERQASLELYPQVVRVTVPHAQLAVPRRQHEVAPEGIVFQDPEHFLLSVGPTGEVLFQYSPSSPGADTLANVAPECKPSPRPALATPAPGEGSGGLSSPTTEAKEKAKSEWYIGRMGEVRVHRTKHGKVVAEVELTVADPDRPGASQLVKFVAFGENADALERTYQPGQEVSAVGIPHELKRRGRDGREWTERQLYFVQLPKPR